jgi:hypothetical protein
VTKPSFAIFGASLLILSLAAPALAVEARLPRAKVVSLAPAASKPAPGKAEDPDDDGVRHKIRHKSRDRDDAERGDKPDAERRHDRD